MSAGVIAMSTNRSGKRTRPAGRRMPRRMRGVTLIELMVAVAIVGIIAAIAYPSYQRQMQETRRSDAKSALLEAAQRLERCYTRFNQYNDTTNCDIAADLDSGGTFDSPESWYEISGNVNAGSFTLTATPQDAQAKDTRCGNLTLTQTGARGASGSATDCW